MGASERPEEAAFSVAGDTGRGAATSYVSAFSGTVIKGAMQNAKSGYLQSLSKTNLATALVTATVDVGKTLHRYFDGEITGVQCIEELGQQGTGEIGAAMFSTMGASVAVSMAPVGAKVAAYGAVGGVIGATLGYTAAIACYQELATALKEAELAREERIRIEKECAEAVALIRQYRQEMNDMVSTYLSDHIQTFNQGFWKWIKRLPSGTLKGLSVEMRAFRNYSERRFSSGHRRNLMRLWRQI